MRLPNLSHRRAGGILLSVLGLAVGAFAADSDDDSSAMIELAPLVSGRPAAPPERSNETWFHGRIGEFEVLTNASPRESAAPLRWFYEHHLLFAELFPQLNAAKRRLLTLLLCANRETLRSVQPVPATARNEGAACFLVGDENVSVLGFEAFATGVPVGIDNAAPSRRSSRTRFPGTGAAGAGELAESGLSIKREYVRFVLSQGEARPPAWLEEGVAQLLDVTELTEGKLRFGRLSPGMVAQLENGSDEIRQLRLGRRDGLEAAAVYFARRGFMPLEEFFARASYTGETRADVRAAFALQSLVFVHYCLHADDGAKPMALQNFVSRLAREPAHEALFTACFGKNHAAFLDDLRDSLRNARYGGGAGRDFVLPAVPAPELRAAKPAEWLRVTAEAQRLGGRTDDAAQTLQRALDQKFADARLYAAIGFLQQQRHRQDEALLAFRNAATAKVDLPGPYLALARYRLRVSSQDNSDGTLTRREFVSAMRFIVAAHAQMRAPRRDLYQTAATAWIRSPVSPLNENLELLEEGVQAFPSDTWLIADTAELKRRIGRIEDAHRLAQLGLRVARDEAVRSRFVNLANETKPGK